MKMEIRPARRSKAKLRLGMSAPSGAGKTYSALLLAHGLGGRVGIIDTEHRSADLYADLLPGGFDVLELPPPFSPDNYVAAIHAFELAGASTIIVDSLSHAWIGEGGALDMQGKIADKTGNSWSAWRTVTPKHNALVEAMLQSPCHIIATMRSKTEYVQESEGGKSKVKKIGLAPIMRDGIEYEFTVMMEIDQSHTANASKDRTRIFKDQFFTITPDTGKKLLAWLDEGDGPPQELSETRLNDALLSISEAADIDALKAAYESAARTASEEQKKALNRATNARKNELMGEQA